MLIKFCGMRRQEDLEYAADLGVDLCGFIFHEKSPRYLHPKQAAILNSFGMARVGVFVEQDARAILEIMHVARLDYAQLHGDQGPECCRLLGKENCIRVLWPQRYNDIGLLNEYAENLADSCSFFLLDGGCKGGGSGKNIPGTFLDKLKLPLPWILAGGLKEKNLGPLLTQFAPDGIDVNSGIESAPGLKCRDKMSSLINMVKSTEQAK